MSKLFTRGLNNFCLFLTSDVIYNPKLLQDINNDFERIAPIAFIYERGTDNSKLISKELKKFYFQDKPLDNSSLGALAQVRHEFSVL